MLHLAILCTSDNRSQAIIDDLLRCDWLGRIRLIITWAVHHLVIATLGVIGGNELFDWQVRYLDLSVLCQCFDAVGSAAGRASGL